MTRLMVVQRMADYTITVVFWLAVAALIVAVAP